MKLTNKELEQGDEHFLIKKTIEELLNDLCNEKSEFHINNPFSLKKNIAQAILKKAFQELI
jgi:hypothetical protein